jgi:hypothetical protein
MTANDYRRARAKAFRIWRQETYAQVAAEAWARSVYCPDLVRRWLSWQCRHRISESLLYNWHSARKAAAVAMGAPVVFL